MAIRNYASALGQIAQESVKDSVVGFGRGIKGAALSEMSGITALYGLGKELKNRANKLQDSSSAETAKESVKEQKKNNVISLNMVRELRSINDNIVKQTKINSLLADAQKQNSMFAEESDREKALRDDKLLEAIKNLSKTTSNITGEKKGSGGFLDSLIDVFKGGLLEAVGSVLAGGAAYKAIKKAFGGGSSSPTSSGGSNRSGGTVPNDVGKRVREGADEIDSRRFGGRGGGAPPGGGGGGRLGGGLLRGAAIGGRLALRAIPYVGWGLLAMDIGSIGYDLYRSFGGRGKGGPKPPDPKLGAGFDAGSGDGWDNVKSVKSPFDKAPAKRRAGAVDAYTGSHTGKVNAAQFITGKEGFVSKATKDTNRMAIGYGHNLTDQEIKSGEIDLGNGNRIKVSGEGGKDTTITQDQADLLFAKDIKKFEKVVVASIGQEAYNKLSENQKTGILSYVYNTGSIPKGFAEAIKSGNYAAAAGSIRNGIANVNPEKVKGWSEEKIKNTNAALRVRRNEEASLFDPGGAVTPVGGVAESKNKTTEAVSNALTKASAKRRGSGVEPSVTPVTGKSITPDGTSSTSNEYVDDGTGRMVLKSELDAIKNKKDSGLKLLNDTIVKSSSVARGSSVTPVTAKPSNLDEYVDDGSGRMVLKSELDAIKNKKDSGLKLLNDNIIKSSATTRLSSGTNLRPTTGPTKPIQVEDKKLNQTAEKQLKETKAVARQTGVVSRATTARLTSSKLSKEQQIIQNANQTFLNRFQSTTQNLLSRAIYDSVVVGAYGKKGSRNLVTKQQAQGEMFRGQELGKAIGLNKKTEKLLTNVFGKEIGKAYGPMVAQLGTAYLEVGSRYVGRELFKGILGTDKDADALTGQILGNFARGNKQAATEQLLYGLTGVASGPETIFAKYGFNSSQQGANFLGGYASAQITAPLAGMLGGKEPTYRGPGGQTYGASQTPTFGAPNQKPAYDAMGRATNNNANPINPAVTQLAIEGDKAARDSLPQIEKAQWGALDQAKQQHKEATQNLLKAEAGTDSYRIAQEQREQATIRLQENTNEILKSKSFGSGSSAGGNFMSGMGNFLFDMGTSYAASKLTKNIKNPYLKAIANFGVSSAANSFIRPLIFGAPTAGAAGGAVGGAASLFTMDNAGTLVSSMMPGSAVGFAGTAGNILASSGYTTAGNFMTGVQSGMNAVNAGSNLVSQTAGISSTSMVAGEGVGKFMAQAAPYAAYIPALLQLAKGDVKGAAITGSLTYAGAKAGAYIGTIIPGLGTVIGGAIGAALGSIVGGLFGKKKKPPVTTIYRVMGSQGNDVNINTTTSTGSPPAEWIKFADTILTALFNSIKLMQQMSNKTLPFEHVGIYLHQNDGIQLSLHQAGEPLNNSTTKWNKWFGKLDAFKPGSGIASMIEFIRDCIKQSAGTDSVTASKLDAAAQELKNKDIDTLTKGVLTELKTGGRYDLSKGVGYDAGKSTTAGGKSTTTKTRAGAVGAVSKSSANTTSTMSNGAVANKIGDQIDSGDIRGAVNTFATNPAGAIIGAVQGTLPGLFGGSSIGSGGIMGDVITPAVNSMISSGVLTPTPQTQTTQTTPTNAVVAVGGNSQVDNSTTIINTLASYKLTDPWSSAVQF
jgi:GH24 family phage-related lysozyme (muramidase)